MATMLRSAAMTLLSKTLLTFLYKYLSDVDVEGVEMPSLYGSTEASSGWGVRLSNVKLREGAELMVLPGGRKSKEPKPPDGNSSEGSVASKGNSTTLHNKPKENDFGDETKGFIVMDIWEIKGKEVKHWDALQPLNFSMRFGSLFLGGKIRNENGIF